VPVHLNDVKLMKYLMSVSSCVYLLLALTLMHLWLILLAVLQCVSLQIQIGRMHAVNGQLRKMRACTVMLTVEQSATAADILPAAVSKLAALDQDMAADDRYLLLLPDGKKVVHVPGSSDEFTVAGYKAFTGRPYQKLTLFVCLQEDYEAG